MGEHTSPKPWAIRDLAVVDRDGRIVCEPTRGPDAEDIVRACNAYDELLAVCRAAIGFYVVLREDAPCWEEHLDAELLFAKATTVYAKAKPPTIEVKR